MVREPWHAHLRTMDAHWSVDSHVWKIGGAQWTLSEYNW